MKKNINLIVIAFIILSFFAFSIFGCESEGGIELRIVSTGGGFSGHYTINGGDENSFNGSEILRDNASTDLYKYSEKLGTFRFIEITANKDDDIITMDMYLYNQHGDIIKKVNNASCDRSRVTGVTTSCPSTTSTMSYTFR